MRICHDGIGLFFYQLIFPVNPTQRIRSFPSKYIAENIKMRCLLFIFIKLGPDISIICVRLRAIVILIQSNCLVFVRPVLDLS